MGLSWLMVSWIGILGINGMIESPTPLLIFFWFEKPLGQPVCDWLMIFHKLRKKIGQRPFGPRAFVG